MSAGDRKYLKKEATSGGYNEYLAVQTSAGVADAGQIAALDATGKWDPSLLPASSYSADVGDGVSTSFLLTHDLGTLDVVPSFRRSSDGQVVEVQWKSFSTTQLQVDFVIAPAVNEFRCTIVRGFP